MTTTAQLKKSFKKGFTEKCEEWRKQINELEGSANNMFGEMTTEANRLQSVLSSLQSMLASGEEARISEALSDAKKDFLITNKYDLKIKEPMYINKMENDEGDCGDNRFLDLFKLTREKKIVPDCIDKPKNFKVLSINDTGRIFLSFTRNTEQEKILTENVLREAITYKALLRKRGDKGRKEFNLKREANGSFSFVPGFLEIDKTYIVKVKMGLKEKHEWSDEYVFSPKSLEFRESTWREYPDYDYGDGHKYFLDEKNPRIATKIGWGHLDSAIIGNIALPQNKVTLWRIKILKSEDNDGGNVFIGVAPSDINQTETLIHNKCGWYFNCYRSTLCSGPPHDYKNKEYGPRKETGKYIHTGDSVGVMMDTTKGELSFVLSGVNLGVAFDGIPLEKPLVPCVIIRNMWGSNSIELI